MCSNISNKYQTIRQVLKQEFKLPNRLISKLKQDKAILLNGLPMYIDKEIYEHYMDKLSLKSLSEKYYLNSAYLGQMFKKKYKVSFKDYLNEYRIEKAAEILNANMEKLHVVAGILLEKEKIDGEEFDAIFNN